ncbi:glycoside hydrolase family 88 protein [Paenibacillus pinihumi]|uniref:glycoside hydrolase family 88 protein n=1 Tax=Paenibacillus pinihumi TaxID=669462 RepID=UPI001B7FAB50|nr:glycoside hydrolase family 88 protein [Paenibacillus pinihumi]
MEKVKRAMLGMQRQSWEQGVAAQSLIESGYEDDALLLAHDAVVRQDQSGRLGVTGDEKAVTDAASNGEPVLFAYNRTGDEKYKQAALQMADYLLHTAPRAENGALSHLNHKSQVWVDSFYMAPPFLSAAGHHEEAVAQIERFRELLLIKDKGMYGHIWDDGEKRFQRADCWGVGNGWAAAGLVRVIRSLPETMSADKQRLIGYLNELLEKCMRYQRDDGLFHDVLDNPDTFVETNAAQMFAYAIYSGVKAGWVDAGYLDHADKIRSAAHTKVDEFGFVRGVCGSPTFDKSGTATEGQAFYILMEAAAR